MDLFNLKGKITIDDSGAVSSLNNIQEKASSTGGKFNDMGNKFKSVGGTVAKVGGTLTKRVTTPLLGIGVGAVKTAMDFQAGMSEVQALSGATGGDLDKLEAKAREMGKSTKYSATEASEGLQYMALAGWDTDQMLAGLEPSLLLAGASGMELGRTTDIVTDTMSMFGMEAERATEMTDVLAYAQANSNLSVDQLGEALVKSGAGANAMGYDLQDTSAILGKFADNGLKGSRAGTVLNAVFRDMKKGAENGAIAIGDSNVAIQNADGSYRDMNDILQDVEKATEGMSQAQRDQALMSIFGEQAMEGMNHMLNVGSEEIREFEEELRNSDGTAKEMYDTMQDNLKGAFEEMKSAISEAGIVIGNILIPMVQSGAEWIGKIAEKFSNLDESTQETIVKIGLFIGALGPVLLIGGKIIGGIGSLLLTFGKIPEMITTVGGGFTAFKTVLLGLNPTVLIIIGVVTALIAIGIALYKNWDVVKEFFINIWEVIKETFFTVTEAIGNFITVAWEGISNFFTTIMTSIGEFITEKWNSIKEFFSTVFNAISIIVQFAWELIKSIISSAITLIVTIIRVPLEIIKALWQTVWNYIGSYVTKIWNNIKSFVTSGINAVQSVISSVMNKIKSVMTTIWNAISKVVSTVINKIQTVVSNVWNKISTVTSSIWNSISSVISSVWNTISSKVSSAINSVRNVVSSVWSAISGVTSSIWNSISSTISSVWSSITGAVSSAINSVQSTVSSVWGSILSTTSSIWNSVKTAIMTPINSARDLVGNAIEAIKGFFSNMKLKFPKIQMPKLPKFSLKGKFSLMPPSVPKLSVNWNKDGAIFDSPTIFGTPRGLQGVGEAGAEAVLPIEKLGGIMADTLNQMGMSGGGDIVIQEMNVRNDNDIVKIAEELDRLKRRKRRG